MPDIGYFDEVRSAAASHRSCITGRCVLIGAIAAGMVLASLATPAVEAARAAQIAGPELTRLLRTMAGLKLLFAAGLVAAAFWRLAVPAAAWRIVSYAVVGAAMAAGPILIWDMASVRLGALLLHGGLLASVLLLWRDPAVGARLADLIATRRASLRTRV